MQISNVSEQELKHLLVLSKLVEKSTINISGEALIPAAQSLAFLHSIIDNIKKELKNGSSG